MNTPYAIQNIRTNPRYPGVLYASVYKENDCCVSATLDYCVEWLKHRLVESEPQICVMGFDVSKLPCPGSGAKGPWCGYCQAERARV